MPKYLSKIWKPDIYLVTVNILVAFVTQTMLLRSFCCIPDSLTLTAGRF